MQNSSLQLQKQRDRLCSLLFSPAPEYRRLYRRWNSEFDFLCIYSPCFVFYLSFRLPHSLPLFLRCIFSSLTHPTGVDFSVISGLACLFIFPASKSAAGSSRQGQGHGGPLPFLVLLFRLARTSAPESLPPSTDPSGQRRRRSPGACDAGVRRWGWYLHGDTVRRPDGWVRWLRAKHTLPSLKVCLELIKHTHNIERINVRCYNIFIDFLNEGEFTLQCIQDTLQPRCG